MAGIAADSSALMQDWTHLPWIRPFSSTTNIPGQTYLKYAVNRTGSGYPHLKAAVSVPSRTAATSRDIGLSGRRASPQSVAGNAGLATGIAARKLLASVDSVRVHCEIWTDRVLVRRRHGEGYCCNMSPGLGVRFPPPQANRVAQCHKHLDE